MMHDGEHLKKSELLNLSL